MKKLNSVTLSLLLAYSSITFAGSTIYISTPISNKTYNGEFIVLNGGGALDNVTMNRSTLTINSANSTIKDLTFDGGLLLYASTNGLTNTSTNNINMLMGALAIADNGIAINGLTLHTGTHLTLSPDGDTIHNLIQHDGVGLVLTTNSTVDGNNSAGPFSIIAGHAKNLLLEAPAYDPNNGLNINVNYLANIDKGILSVLTNNSSENTLIGNGGTEFVDGGATLGTVVGYKGEQLLKNRGHSSGTIVNTGGVQTILSGSQSDNSIIRGVQNVQGDLLYTTGSLYSFVNNTIIDNGGMQLLNSGAKGLNSTILNNGLMYVKSSALDDSATVQYGGIQYVDFNGKTKNTKISGVQHLNGNSDDVIINDGGVQFIDEKGIASGSIINDKGIQNINLNGSDKKSVISTGGKQYIKLGGKSEESSVAGGEQHIQTGGISDKADVKNGGIQYVHDGGNSTLTVLNDGGTQTVEANGTTSSTVINNKGVQNLWGGLASDIVLNNGGVQNIKTGGSVTGMLINGGNQSIENGGSSKDTTIENSGIQTIKVGASADNSNVTSGVINLNGGTLNNSTFSTLGTLYAKGGALTGTSTLNGGTLAGDDLINSGDFHYIITSGADKQFSGKINGTGSFYKQGDGNLSLTGTLNQKTTYVKQGSVVFDDLSAATDIIGDAQTSLQMINSTTFTGTIDPMDVSLDQTSSWVVTGDSIVNTLDNAGSVSFTSGNGYHTLTMHDLNGKNGTFTLNTQLGDSSSLTDKLIIDGGSAQGSSNLLINNNGGLGAKTTGDGIEIVSTTNGGTTNANAFKLIKKVLAGAFEYNLRRNSTSENWFLTTDTPAPPVVSVLTVPMTTLTPSQPASTGAGAKPTVTSLPMTTLTPSKPSSSSTASTGAGAKPTVISLPMTTLTPSKPATVADDTAASTDLVTSNPVTNSRPNYREEMSLYAALYSQVMDYDGTLSGSLAQRNYLSQSNQEHDRSVWGRMGAGSMQHRGNGDLMAQTPKSSGQFYFAQIGSDILRTQWRASEFILGGYGAIGSSSMNVDHSNGQRAGKSNDDIYSLGSYLTAKHTPSGLWVDIVLQGSRHNMTTHSSNELDLNTSGWGYLASIEAGMPFTVAKHFIIEPQVQYQYRQASINSSNDSAADVEFGSGHANFARAGVLFGNKTSMDFGQGTSERSGIEKTMKHSSSELPFSWWVRPSVVQVFGSQTDMNVSVDNVSDSDVSFHPDQNGSALDLQSGIEIKVRKNLTIGLTAGYTKALNNELNEGVNGNALLKGSF